MKRISLLLVTVLVCMISSAQVTWNVKAGAGLATLRGDVEDVQGKLGWKIGVGIEKPLSVNWLIMPSLEYKQKGTSFSNNYYEETISMSYLQLPILGAYRIRLSDDVNMALKVGPYLAYMLSGKDKYTENGVKNEIDLFDLEDEIGKRFDAGLLLGVDFEFHRFVLGTEFEYGLLPCFEYLDFKAYNMSLYVTLGYKF